MAAVPSFRSDLPLGYYTLPDDSHLVTYSPGDRNYNATSALHYANPYAMQREEGSDFDAWWEGYKSRILTTEGRFEVLGTSVGMNVGYKLFMPAILKGLISGCRLRAPKNLFAVSSGLMSVLMSGGMILYQRYRYSNDEIGLLDWGRSILFSIPSVFLGMQLLPKANVRMTIRQDITLEFFQALASVVMGYLVTTPQRGTNMGFLERVGMELCEGALYFGTGRVSGTGISYLTDFAGTVPYHWTQAKSVRRAIDPHLDREVRLWGEEEVPQGRVWVKENAVESDGQTRLAPLRYLAPGTQTLESVATIVRGKRTIEDGNFDHQPPTDEFAQVIAYHTLSEDHFVLEALGYKPWDLMASLSTDKGRPVPIFVNAFRELNAYYSPAKRYLAIGEGILDTNVHRHENGHKWYHHSNPSHSEVMAGPWAAAMHEAYGDAWTCLIDDDPELGEAFWAQIEKQGGDKKKGLRNLNNEHKLSDFNIEEDDPHQVALVPGAFVWSLKQRFESELGIQRGESNRLALRLLVEHSFLYSTGRPAPIDTIEAFARAALSIEKKGLSPKPALEVERLIRDEAGRRGLLIGAAEQPEFIGKLPPVTHQSAQRAVEYYTNNSGVRFRQVSASPHLTGTFVRLQQRYRTRIVGEVDVIGHGMNTWFDQDGSSTRVSHNDVRWMRRGEVIEEINVSYPEALHALKWKLQEALKEVEEELAGIHPDDFESRIWNQRRRHVLRLIQDEFKQAALKRPKLVVVGDETTLSYEVDLTFGTFYVPAYFEPTPTPFDLERILYQTSVFI